jgi:hypothetical protein
VTAPEWATQISPPEIHQLPARKGGPPTEPFTWQRIQAQTQFFLDTFIGQVAIAFGGIEIFGWQPFAFLVEWGEERIADAARNYAAALNAQGSANYANSQLGALAASRFAAESGGVALTASFNGASANNFGAGFTRTSTGAGAGHYGPDGNGLAVWKKSGGNDRTHIDRNNTPLTTDYQVVIVVLATVPQAPFLGANAYNYFGGRLNAALTTYVYVRVGYNDLQLGCVVAGTVTPFSTVSFTPAIGDEIRLYLGTTTDVREFIVTRNGDQVLAYTDTGAVSQYGISNLYAGLAETAGNRASEFGLFLFADQTVPASLDSWAAADRLPGSI